MSIRIRNESDYDSAEVRRLVRRTLRELECDDVEVLVKHSRKAHATGHYREWWYPMSGERGPVITVSLPRPGVELEDYHPYLRKREQGRRFPLATWQEALVAITAHEGMHHKQTPRHGYGTVKKRGRYVEVEADLAAYRAWVRYTGRSA